MIIQMKIIYGYCIIRLRWLEVLGVQLEKEVFIILYNFVLGIIVDMLSIIIIIFVFVYEVVEFYSLLFWFN